MCGTSLGSQSAAVPRTFLHDCPAPSPRDGGTGPGRQPVVGEALRQARFRTFARMTALMEPGKSVMWAQCRRSQVWRKPSGWGAMARRAPCCQSSMVRMVRGQQAREHGPGCVRRPHRGHPPCGIVMRRPWSTAWAVGLLHHVVLGNAWSHAPTCRVLRLRHHKVISLSEGVRRLACSARFFSLGCHTALRPQQGVSDQAYVVRACPDKRQRAARA
jgi:hypothetical protein